MHICFSLSIFKNLSFYWYFLMFSRLLTMRKKKRKRYAQFFKMINSLYHLNNKSSLGLGYWGFGWQRDGGLNCISLMFWMKMVGGVGRSWWAMIFWEIRSSGEEKKERWIQWLFFLRCWYKLMMWYLF
jgi:hypothetical protein